MGYKDPEKQREYQRKWMAKRKEEFFKDKECVECGDNEYLELDHIDPETKVTHSVWSWSKERREVELAKCQVLCENCHKKKTSEYRKAKARENPHGTHTRYRFGCFCNKCRAGHAEYKRERQHDDY